MRDEREMTADTPDVEVDAQTPSERPENPLRNEHFRWLWANNLGYALVINSQRFTFGWLVLDGLNRSEGWQGLVAFTLGIPVALLVLHAGVWADRVDRRRLLIGSQVGGLAVMVATTALVAADRVGIVAVIVLTLLAGATQAVGQPVRQALVPALVRREQLVPAIALNAIAMTLSMIIGPVLAKVIGDAFGFEGTFGFQTVLLALGLVFLLPLRVPPHEAAPSTEPVRRQLAEAIRHIRGEGALSKLFLLLMVTGVTVNPAVMVSLQALIKDEFGRDSGDAGPLLGLMGLGIAVTSALVMRKGDMANKGAAFMRAAMTGSTMVFLMGQAPSFGFLIPLTLIMGLAGGFYINMNQGLIQANTPQPLMGRVMAMFTLIQLGFMPVGALVLGLVGEAIGIGNAMSAAAVVSFVTIATIYAADPEFRKLR